MTRHRGHDHSDVSLTTLFMLERPMDPHKTPGTGLADK
ncbi:hypothetical protein SAMN02745831_01115 [Streptomyces sp. PgraA7]|nr:hypothetical protein SAMN02745831_01115 [Streptomyces sp. PgraA7]